MIIWLFMLGVITIPFNDFGHGQDFFGMLASELSAYFFVACMLVFAWRMVAGLRQKESVFDDGSYRVLLYFSVFLVVVGASFLAHTQAIWVGAFRGQTALYRYFSFVEMCSYGFILSYVSYFVARYDWDQVIIKPIVISLVLCFLFSVFEVGSWYDSGIGAIYTSMSQALRVDIDHPFSVSGAIGHLFSVCYEPSFFGQYAGLAFPWLCVIFFNRQGFAKWGYGLLFVLLNVMLFMNNSRTGVIALVGNWTILPIVFALFYWRSPQALWARHLMIGTAVVMGIGVMVLAMVYFNQFVYWVVQGVAQMGQEHKASNLTRLGMSLSALAMWRDHFFFGIGWGQFGFHAAHYMPSWAWYNPEIVEYMTNPDFAWPNSFSMFPKLLAELGIVGLLLWGWLWLGLAYAVLKRVWQTPCMSLRAYCYGYVLIAGCCNVLLLGIASDSFRPPMIWITLGFVCRYLHVQKRIVG